ncbi:hypothetical protein HZC08_00555 [Candidatus Micrarchaeota archaeon]|nr:hypothetical protein [Candidatus Micrarchaeota archaeon]
MVELARTEAKIEKEGPVKRTIRDFGRLFASERGNLKFMLRKHTRGKPMADTLVTLYNRADPADKEWLLRKMTRMLTSHLLQFPNFEKALDAMKFVTGICTGEKNTYAQDSKNPNLTDKFEELGKLIDWALAIGARPLDSGAEFYRTLMIESVRAKLVLNPGQPEKVVTLLRTWIKNPGLKEIALNAVLEAGITDLIREFFRSGELPLKKLLNAQSGRTFLTSEITEGKTEVLERLYIETELSLRSLISDWCRNINSVGYALAIATNSQTLNEKERVGVFRQIAGHGFYPSLEKHIDSTETRAIVMEAVLGVEGSEDFLASAIKRVSPEAFLATLLSVQKPYPSGDPQALVKLLGRLFEAVNGRSAVPASTNMVSADQSVHLLQVQIVIARPPQKRPEPAS